MKFLRLTHLSAVIVVVQHQKTGPTSFTLSDIHDVTVPSNWEEICVQADDALRLIESDVLSDHIPEDELTSQFSDVCDPTDDCIETFCSGERSIQERLVSAVEGGALIESVLDAVYNGELSQLFRRDKSN